MSAPALKVVDMTPAHSRFGASGAHRWMACPASISMSAGLPDSTSDFAREGSIAHYVAEQCLAHRLDASEFLGLKVEDLTGLDSRDVIPGLIVGEEMVEAVQTYLDYVRALQGELFVEVRLDYSKHVPEGFGTADAVVYDADDKTLWVVDLKYGQGVRVDAWQNEQGQLYAVGALDQFKWLGEVERVFIVIVQPRLDHISEWSQEPSALYSFAKAAGLAAADALSDNPSFGPGEKPCKFCRSSGNCAAQAEYNLKTAQVEFMDDDTAPCSPHGLSGENLAWVLSRLSSLSDWIKAVESRAASVIEAGEQIPGYKLVEGRSLRKWSDDRDVVAPLETALGDDAWAKKILTVAQAEKLLGKKHELLAEWAVKPPGKPTLVPESDKRPAIRTTAEQDFAD